MAQRIGTYRLGNIIIFHSVKYFTNLFVQYFTIYRALYRRHYLHQRQPAQERHTGHAHQLQSPRLHLTV